LATEVGADLVVLGYKEHLPDSQSRDGDNCQEGQRGSKCVGADRQDQRVQTSGVNVCVSCTA